VNTSDLFGTIAALDSIPPVQLREFLKSEEGQELLKAVAKYGEEHGSEELHEHPARGTEGKDKSKWHEAVDAATQHGKKKASYALSQYIFNKMDKSYGEFVKSAEGSRGGKVIGHTKSGKPVYEASHETYTALGKLPKYNGKVSVHTALGSDSGKLLRQRTDFNKQDHLDAAEHHSREANRMDTEHTIAKHEAEKKAYGKVRGLSEGYYKTSGGVDENYSPEENDRIRDLAHSGSRHRSAAMAHEYAAKGYREVKKSYDEFVKSKKSKKVEKDVTDSVSMRDKKDLVKPGYGLFGEQTSY
jgi:hypothetical protein